MMFYAQSPFCPPHKGLLRGAISPFSPYSLCHNTSLPAKIAPGPRRRLTVRALSSRQDGMVAGAIGQTLGEGGSTLLITKLRAKFGTKNKG